MQESATEPQITDLQPNSADTSNRLDFPCALILVLITFLAYCRTFSVPFGFDDYANIVWNYNIRTLSIPTIFNMKPSRFFAMYTFTLNYHFNGVTVTWYHVVNLLIHIGAALAFYWLLGNLITTLEKRNGKPYRYRALIRLFGAAVFALHPLQTQAVTYTIQRIESMAGMFYILTVACYVSGRLAVTLRKKLVMFPLTIISLFAGMMCKETTFTAPFVILLVEFIIIADRESQKHFIRRIIRMLPLFLLLPIIPFLLNVQGILGRLKSDSGITPFPYFLTQMKVHFIYLKLLVYPWGQTIDYDIDLTLSPFEPRVIFGFIVLSALFVGAFALARKFPLIALGILWYFFAISISSSFIPIPDFIFEHRVYPAMPGFAMVLCGVILRLKGRAWIPPVLVIIMLCLGCLTFLRNELWRQPHLLWTANTKRTPGKARPYLNLAIALADKAKAENPDSPDYTGAKKALFKTIELKPNLDAAHFKLGMIYEEEGHLDKAIAEYKKTFTNKFVVAGASERLGMILYKEKKDDEGARDMFVFALQLFPQNTFCHAKLGVVYSNLGESQKSIRHYREALRLQPNMGYALKMLAIEYLKVNDSANAIAIYSTILNIAAKQGNVISDASIYKGLSEAYGLAGDHGMEKKYLDIALEKKPNYLDALWARLKFAMQDPSYRNPSSDEAQKARECARRILMLNPKHRNAHALKKEANRPR